MRNRFTNGFARIITHTLSKWMLAIAAMLVTYTPMTALAAWRGFHSSRSGSYYSSSRSRGGLFGSGSTSRSRGGLFSHGATHYGSTIPHYGIGSHMFSFGLGYLFGGMFHPFGGYYGWGSGYMYHPFSLGHLVIDLIILWIIFRIVRRMFR